MIRLALPFSLLLCASFAQAAPLEKRTVPQFIRLEEKNGEAVALQTAVAHYKSEDGSVQVDLIGAIHIADAKYFETLSLLFERYDAVLYELVAPPDKIVPDRFAKNRDALAMLQELMTDVLGLEHQLKGIDYSKKNLVHADLSPEGMQKALEDRGETPISLLLGITADMVRSSALASGSSSSSSSSAPTDDFDEFVKTATDPDGSRKLKQQLARQFAAEDSFTGMPRAVEASLIQDRNAAAMKVFDEVLKKRQAARAPGAGPLKIAIFYGAAHLADFHRRLLADYPIRPTGLDWITAWDMSTPETASPAVRFLYKSLGETLRELMQQP